LLHELGHRTLHRNINPPALFDQQARRQYEDEADAFAFKHIARLLTEPEDRREAISVRTGLFNRRNIDNLPEPDRSAAIVASLIQEFSVNLLFSNAAVSTFDSGVAHKAFVERFKPQLSGLLPTTTTREGRTYVLLALAAVERIEEVGRNIVAEIASELPIVDVQFDEAGLKMKVLLASATSEKSATPKQGTIRLPRSSFSATGTTKLKVLAGSAMPDPPTENANNRENAADTTITPFVLPDIVEATRALRDDAQGLDWWPDRAETKRPKTEILVAQLDETYVRVRKSPCQIKWHVRDYPNMDVTILCADDFFAGRFDVENQRLSDLEQLQGLHQRTFPNSEAFTANDIVEVVDVRIDGKRRIYLVEDTLSDRPHVSPHKLRVWSASRGRPRLLGELDLLTDWIPTGSSIHDWFEISHPPVLTCQLPTEETAVCTEFLDSIFQIDLKSGKISVLFHPAGVRRTRDVQGHYAFYARGGFRLFITRLESRQ